MVECQVTIMKERVVKMDKILRNENDQAERLKEGSF